MDDEKTPTPPEMQTETAPDTFDREWSWGGFMMEQVLIIASRRYWYLALYLLLLIPFVQIFAIIAIKLYFGFRGREFVRAGDGFDSEEAYRGFMKGLDHAGKILFFIALIAFIIAFIASVFLGFAIFEKNSGLWQELEQLEQYEDGNFRIDIRDDEVNIEELPDDTEVETESDTEPTVTPESETEAI